MNLLRNGFALGFILSALLCSVSNLCGQKPPGERTLPGVQNPFEIWGATNQELSVFSHQGITYRAVVDVLHGGVISCLNVPGHGPNLICNDQRAAFRGFMNTFYMTYLKDPKDGKDKVKAKGTLWWLKNITAPQTRIVQQSPEAVVIETSGEKPGMGVAEEKVLKYRLRYTFKEDRIICENFAEWVYGHGTYLAEMSLLHYLQPQSCRHPVYVIDKNGQEVELPISSSGGTHYPEGIEYPFAIRVPLQNGVSMNFKLLEAPRAFRENRWYLLERPWQNDWAQLVAFTGMTKKEENAFENQVVYTKHECVFTREPLTSQNPIVEIIAPAGVEPAVQPGAQVVFEAIARDADFTPLPADKIKWEFFLNWQEPGGSFTGGRVTLPIPGTDGKHKPVTTVWARVSVTGKNGRKGCAYARAWVDEKTPYGVWGDFSTRTKRED